MWACVCVCFIHLKQGSLLSVVVLQSRRESNSEPHTRLYFNHDNKPPVLSTDTCVRKICRHQQSTSNIWVRAACMLMCMAQAVQVATARNAVCVCLLNLAQYSVQRLKKNSHWLWQLSSINNILNDMQNVPFKMAATSHRSAWICRRSVSLSLNMKILISHGKYLSSAGHSVKAGRGVGGWVTAAYVLRDGCLGFSHQIKPWVVPHSLTWSDHITCFHLFAWEFGSSQLLETIAASFPWKTFPFSLGFLSQ